MMNKYCAIFNRIRGQLPSRVSNVRKIGYIRFYNVKEDLTGACTTGRLGSCSRCQTDPQSFLNWGWRPLWEILDLPLIPSSAQIPRSAVWSRKENCVYWDPPTSSSVTTITLSQRANFIAPVFDSNVYREQLLSIILLIVSATHSIFMCCCQFFSSSTDHCVINSGVQDS